MSTKEEININSQSLKWLDGKYKFIDSGVTWCTGLVDPQCRYDLYGSNLGYRDKTPTYKGCGFMGRTTECSAYYSPDELKRCIEGNPLSGFKCHPHLSSNDNGVRDSAEKFYTWDLLNKGVAPYRSAYKDWEKNYKTIVRAYCDKPGFPNNNGICNTLCDKDLCPNNRMYRCHTPNLDLSNDCVGLKDNPNKNYKEFLTYIQKEYNYYKAMGDKRFELDAFLYASMHKNLPENFAYDYDRDWREFCNKNPDHPRCTCILQDEVIQLKDDSGQPAIRPDCLSSKCQQSVEDGGMSYQPYSSVRKYISSGVQCPNICSQVLQLTSGNISIANNINFVQKCFNSTESQVIDSISNAVLNDIGENRDAYSIACVLLNKKPLIINEIQNESTYRTLDQPKNEYANISSCTQIYEVYKTYMESIKIYVEKVEYIWITIGKDAKIYTNQLPTMKEYFNTLYQLIKSIMENEDKLDKAIADYLRYRESFFTKLENAKIDMPDKKDIIQSIIDREKPLYKDNMVYDTIYDNEVPKKGENPLEEEKKEDTSITLDKTGAIEIIGQIKPKILEIKNDLLLGKLNTFIDELDKISNKSDYDNLLINLKDFAATVNKEYVETTSKPVTTPTTPTTTKKTYTIFGLELTIITVILIVVLVLSVIVIIILIIYTIFKKKKQVDSINTIK